MQQPKPGGCREWVSKMKENNMLCSMVSCNRKQAFSEAKHCSSECLWICDFLQCEFYLATCTLHIDVQSIRLGDPGTGTQRTPLEMHCVSFRSKFNAISARQRPIGSISTSSILGSLHSAEQFHQTTGPLSPTILDGIIEWGLDECNMSACWVLRKRILNMDNRPSF